MCTKFHLHVWCILLASLSSEEVILKTNAWGSLLLWLSWKQCNTHAHQVSPSCILQLASLRSEEVVIKKIVWGFFKQYSVVMETCNRHGNCIIGIHNKFPSPCVLYTIGKFEKWRSKFKEKCLSLFVVIYKHVLLLLTLGAHAQRGLR